MKFTKHNTYTGKDVENMLTFKQIRDRFFELSPEYQKERRAGKTHNEFSTDVRCDFNQYTENLHRSGIISTQQSENITLKG
jgi:hypothetical protein